MALKFLNKKGWHTGSLRNIENVWKAEQKHEAEQKKLEELKKQILDERETLEFRRLQEQAGLVPKQERLEFLYDSGLAVGKSSDDAYLLGKPVEEKKDESEIAQVAAVPGALFVEEKPYSANDTWRKLHSDPLLLIRQQEQAALAHIRNNPVKMEMIKKSVKEKTRREEKEKRKAEKKQLRKEKKKKKREKARSESSGSSSDDTRHRRRENGTHSRKEMKHSEDSSRRSHDGYATGSNRKDRSLNMVYSAGSPRWNYNKEVDVSKGKNHETDVCRGEYHGHRSHNRLKERETSVDDLEVAEINNLKKRRCEVNSKDDSHYPHSKRSDQQHQEYQIKGDVRERVSEGWSGHQKSLERNGDAKPRGGVPDSEVNLKPKNKVKYETGKLSEEEKAARLRKMQADAEVHEEQRWHRLKKAADSDLQEEAKQAASKNGRNFLEITSRSVYGAEKGGSASVEESVRRRTHFIERSIGDGNTNTFRR